MHFDYTILVMLGIAALLPFTMLAIKLRNAVASRYSTHVFMHRKNIHSLVDVPINPRVSIMSI